MELTAGADVYAANGEKVGELERIVVDPKSREVTHIILEKGTFTKTEKVVPIGLVTGAGRERVTLGQAPDALDGLPDFEDERYVVARDRDWAAGAVAPAAAMPGTAGTVTGPGLTPLVHWYPPAYMGDPGHPPAVLGVNTPAGAAEELEVNRNIPAETVPLKEGAKVVALDGETLGEVERLFTDPETNKVTHVILARGLLLKSRKAIPMEWVADVSEASVRLAVSQELVNSVKDYEG
jgi:sporulation protein YlmC with PRC-barrel domain